MRFDRAEPLKADIVILATAYGPQEVSATGALAPFDGVAPERFANAKSMALIGSGLTMVDVLLGARRDGFAGTATVISRRGQLPRAHASQGVVPQQVGLPQSKRMSRLANAVRIACEAAEVHGTPWQASHQRSAAFVTGYVAGSHGGGTVALSPACPPVLGRAPSSLAGGDP